MDKEYPISEGVWNIQSLKELADEREKHRAELRELDREAVRIAVQTQREQRAEDKRAEELWRASQNEWRGQSKDRESTFVTREAFEATLRNLAGDRLSGRTDARGTVQLIVGVVGGALGAIAFAISIFITLSK